MARDSRVSIADTRERAYAVACGAMFVFGIILGLPGTVLGLPEVAAQFQLTLAARGTLISMLFVGLLIGCLLSGPLVDAFGLRRSVAISAALVAVCLPLFAAASNFVPAAVAMAALGLASAGMNTAANALSSDLFPGERGRRMNGIALVVGLGGLAMPMATALGSGHVSWRVIVIAGGVVAALVATAGLLDPDARRVRRQPGHHESPLQPLRRLLRQPGVTWFGILLMLGAATEGAMAGWTSTFLTSVGFSAEAATWALSSHWLGLIVGRLLFSGRVDRVKRAAIVRAAVAGAVCVLLFVIARAPAALAAGPFVIGVAIAVIVPTSLAFAGDRHPGNPGTLFGALLTLAQVGGIVLPALIGAVAERAGVRAGLSILGLNCLLVAVVAGRAGRSATTSHEM